MKDEIFKKPYWLEDSQKKNPDAFSFEKITGTFSFDQKVSRVFDDMAQRSIPGYQQTMAMIIELSVSYLFEREKQHNKNLVFYDLGCSTGNLLFLLQKRLKTLDFFQKSSLNGIDSSLEMIKIAREKQQTWKKNDSISIHFVESHLLDFLLTLPEKADCIFLNYTLQFIKPSLREKVLKQIHQTLKKNGLFFLSEKVIEQSESLTKSFEAQHFLFKKKQCYSDLELAAKKESLENILIPQSVENHLKQIQSSGFSQTAIMSKWYNFATIVAIKE